MRILQILDCLAGTAAGGMQVVAEATARELAKRGHEVVLVADLSGLAVRNDAIVRVDRPIARNAIAYFADGRSKILSIDRSYGVDVLHAHFALAALAGRAAIPRRASVRTYHGSWDLEASIERDGAPASLLGHAGERAKAALRFGIDATDIRASRAVVALSDFSVAQLTDRFHVPRAKIAKISGGVDADRFAPRAPKHVYKERLGISGAPMLFTAGRLVRRKGFDRLIGAMPAIVRRFPNAMLVIGGDGPERAALESLVARLGLAPNVALPGRLDATLVNHYRAADVFVLSSLGLETFGLVTIEALASGTIAVGTPSGATPEILRELDERLVAADASSDALATAVLAVLTESWGTAFTQDRLVAHVRARYAWEAHVDALERVYESVSARGGR